MVHPFQGLESKGQNDITQTKNNRPEIVSGRVCVLKSWCILDHSRRNSSKKILNNRFFPKVYQSKNSWRSFGFGLDHFFRCLFGAWYGRHLFFKEPNGQIHGLCRQGMTGCLEATWSQALRVAELGDFLKRRRKAGWNEKKPKVSRYLHSRKLTCPLNIDGWKMYFLLK